MRQLKLFSYFVFISKFLIFPSFAHAAYELGVNFSYNRSVYGSERQNKQTSRTYSGSWAFYLSRLTAIELNYSYTDDITVENNNIFLDDFNLTITGTKNTVNRQVYGLGLKQFFARRGALIRPSISLGYAKQFVTDSTDITFEDTVGNTATVSGATTRRREDSVFGTVGLQFRLTQTIALDASVNTVFKAFEFNRAGDNLRYSLGLRWYFL